MLSIYKKFKASTKLMHIAQSARNTHIPVFNYWSGGDKTWSIKINGTIFESMTSLLQRLIPYFSLLLGYTKSRSAWPTSNT
jgi:hypothetical protein